MWHFIENWRGHKWKEIFSVQAVPKQWLQRGHNPNLDVNQAEIKSCWKLELFKCGCAELSPQLHPTTSPKIPAAAVDLCSQHNIKFYQQWCQMDENKFMNCERFCLFWVAVIIKAQSWTGKLSKNDSQGPFHIEYYAIQSNWTHCAPAIVITHFVPFSLSPCTENKKLALWCAQQQSPLQGAVTPSNSSSISCTLSAAVSSPSPAHLWPEVTGKAERAELQHHSNAAAQSTRCPLPVHIWAALEGSRAQQWGALAPNLEELGHKPWLSLLCSCSVPSSSSSSSATPGLSDPKCFASLPLTIDRVWVPWNSMENTLHGLQQGHILHAVLMQCWAPKKSSPHLGLLQTRLMQEKPLHLRRKVLQRVWKQQLGALRLWLQLKHPCLIQTGDCTEEIKLPGFGQLWNIPS